MVVVEAMREEEEGMVVVVEVMALAETHLLGAQARRAKEGGKEAEQRAEEGLEAELEWERQQAGEATGGIASTSTGCSRVLIAFFLPPGIWLGPPTLGVV